MSTEYGQLDGEKVAYKGIFNFEELYEHLYHWLEWHKFSVREKKYKEKVTPKGKEYEIEWEAEKDIDGYSKMVVKAKWLAVGISDVEVAKDDKKIKMQKGEVEIKVSASLVTDKNDEWEQKLAFKFMKNFYERYLYRDMIDSYKSKVWKAGWDFYNEIKAFLNLYRFGQLEKVL